MAETRKRLARQESSGFWLWEVRKNIPHNAEDLKTDFRITRDRYFFARNFAHLHLHPPFPAASFSAMVSPGSASASLLTAVALLPRVAAGEFFNQLAIVRRIKHLEIDLRVERPQAADFAILARDERLTQRRQLNVEVVLWQVKIGR